MCLYKKKSVIAIIFTLVLCLFTACNSSAQKDANALFEETRDSLINTILSDSPLDLHFCLSDTIEFDAENTQKTLTFSDGEENALQTAYESLLNIDSNELNKDNLYQYKVLTTYTKNQIALSTYDYKYEPLSAFSGEQVQIPLLLAEFPFHGSSDLDIYLKLLEDIPDYFNQLIEYEQQKKEAGEFMSENCFRTVVEFCKSFPLENASEHFLAKAFNNKLDNLYIKDELKTAYINDHIELLETKVFPAYLKLAEDLEQIATDAAFNNEGLCHSPSGCEYYSALVTSSTGDSRSLKAIGEELEVNLATSSQLLHSSIMANAGLWTSVSDKLYEELESDRVKDIAGQYLDSLYLMAKNYFGYEKKKNYSVEYIEPTLSNYFSSAFFLLPPVDDFSSPTIYINPDTTFTGFDLFTTLAHEGYPGHLTQTLTQKDNLFTRLFSCLGYCEGWATYVELYSYPAAIRALDICEEEQVENVSYILKQYREVTLCVYALLDYNIHYNYWTVDDAASLLSDYGISDEETICQIYNYIVNEPANYMTYYVGYMNVVNLKEEYIANGHTEEEFHKAFLQCGEAPFEIVKTKLLP